jgi:polysaccharide export outer membrane protein
MRNKDVIFASNAQTVETTKLMAYLRQITATVNDPLMAAVNAYTIKNLASGAAATTAIVTGAVGP